MLVAAMPRRDCTGDETSAAEVDTIVESETAGLEVDDDEGGLCPGARLGRYVVLEEIGAGGMGLVFSAHDPELDRKVALKLLQPRLRERKRKRTRSRLLEEAQALAKLAHPNVITVYDVGTLGDRVFVAMELVEGDTLAAWLEERPRTWSEVLEVFIPAGRGLSAAHAAELVHRDFKPENVLIGRDGRVRVMDFGLARPVSARTPPLPDEPPETMKEPGSSIERQEVHDVEDPMLTQTGSIMGTPAYMAPEQHVGRPTDHRSDQYSFSIALYQGLYGERPFDERTASELARQKLDGHIEDPPAGVQVPAWVRRIVLRGLSADPQERYGSMDAMLDELIDDPRVKRRKVLTAGGTIGLIAGGVLGIYHLRDHRPDVCGDSPDVFASVWNDARKAEAEAGIEKIDGAHVSLTWQKAAATMDAYGEAWIEMHRQACEATHIRGEQSTRLLELRNDCLRERLDEIDALAGLFAEADAEIAARAAHASLSISPLSDCADSETLAAAVDPPDDGATRQAVAELRRQLARVKALDDVGKRSKAVALADASLTAARELDYGPLVAEARYRLGQVQGHKGDSEQAEDNLSESAWLGASVRHDAIAAAAASELVGVVGRTMGRHEEGLAWGRHAEAALERIGMGGARKARLFHDIGVIHDVSGEHDKGSASLEQARELYEDVPFSDLARVELLRDLGHVRLHQGRTEEAIATFEQAEQEAAQMLGTAHPEVALAIAGLARAADREDDHRTARARYHEAIAIVETALGPEAMELVPLHDQLADSCARHGAFDEAIEHEKKAYQVLVDALGDHPRVATALYGLGNTLIDAGHLDEARRRHERALTMWEKTRGQDHPDVAFALTALGQLDLDTEQVTRAVERLERALELRGGRGLDPRLLAHTQFALARALQAAGGDHPRARELATRARDTFRRAESPDPRAAAEIDAWLGSTPLAPSSGEPGQHPNAG